MELTTVRPPQSNGLVKMEVETPVPRNNTISTGKPFIQANTEDTTFEDVRDKHIIPVFIKDNEPLISHADFIDTTMEVVSEIYTGELILSPSIRVSHPIKGRIPEARNKPANELFEHEKTIYYERLAFIIEIPTVYDDIEGNTLSLTVGGIKAYNLDNLYGKKGSDEHFKIFVGFRNSVCTNLCVSTDGYMGELKVNSLGQLKGCIRTMLENYNIQYHMKGLQALSSYSLTEQQFANLIGRCRMFPHLSKPNDITPLLFGDTQLGMIVKDYYRDDSFCRDENGNINLWRLYNLFTGANRSTYIDNFLDKSVNAFQFAYSLKMALEQKTANWFLN